VLILLHHKMPTTPLYASSAFSLFCTISLKKATDFFNFFQSFDLFYHFFFAYYCRHSLHLFRRSSIIEEICLIQEEK